MTEQSLTAKEGTTFRLLYRSRHHLTGPDREEELGDLFATSRSNNKKRGITGALLLSGHWFVQVLEGAEADVRSLYASIEKDRRHRDVELLFAGPADGPVFAHWSMAKVALSDTDLPLIARISEISPADSRAMTDAQRHLLQVMRDAVDEPPST